MKIDNKKAEKGEKLDESHIMQKKSLIMSGFTYFTIFDDFLLFLCFKPQFRAA